VTEAGAPVTQINELECVGGAVWANIWQTDDIVRIDPADGRVTAVVDASGLLDPARRAGTDVLNGIAAVPGTDEFLLTGKFWPSTFRVRFVT
jgi:glutaminyl-peptide cyclotransferase